MELNTRGAATHLRGGGDCRRGDLVADSSSGRAATTSGENRLLKKKWAKSLGAYLHYLIETRPPTTLIVELKCGTSYEGTVVDVDDGRGGRMDLTLSDVHVASPPRGDRDRASSTSPYTYFDTVHLRGSTVRYISFGGRVGGSGKNDRGQRRRGPVPDWSRAIRDGMSREEVARKKYTRMKRKAPA
eukprot:CAMPEP_0113299554 /NCGR_PEP_ID=MMETSP0010_2-20120614/1544_1 /TAXON_ID=216773 ORGANISM="Corethron hystrix, Strain 308" /NCGR_SAMPLE_ID=MMETSP0010_2 /ASSEMBLY_ACC=CAM_ASM_000155 /LENGTH=185 /DNA_ID=CAMNT_0000152815 /DNA_START=85 /DNA_END=639 /DNA_ORIENTATION=+ /assembly_acc=CAM_ASM_000155